MPRTVCVDPGPAGNWLITVPGQSRVIAGDMLSDAIRQARRIAETDTSCQLVVRDAYHRVIHRQFVGEQTPPISPPSNAPISPPSNAPISPSSNAGSRHEQRTRPRYGYGPERAAYTRNWRSNSGHQPSST
jgi:hypothetical protein